MYANFVKKITIIVDVNFVKKLTFYLSFFNNCDILYYSQEGDNDIKLEKIVVINVYKILVKYLMVKQWLRLKSLKLEL